ncbi:EamA family transporter [Nocardia sp. NPDC003979]
MSVSRQTSDLGATPKIIAAMVILWLCWGTSFPAMRIMVRTLPPLLAAGTAFLIAGAVLATVRSSDLRALTRRQAATAAGVGVTFLGAQGGISIAVQHVYASTAAVLAAAVPLWVLFLGLVVGDRPSLAGISRIAFGFAGVAVVLLADADQRMGWSLWSLAVVAAAVSWAVGTMWSSRSVHLPPPGAATAVQLLVGGSALLLIGIACGQLRDLSAAEVHTSSWLALLYLVLVDSLAGFALYNWLLRCAPVSLVSTYAYAVPVVAYFFGVCVLGEPFHLIVLIGAGMIVATVAAEILGRGTAEDADRCAEKAQMET